MLIGICGGICSGKKTVAEYLVEHHGFKRLYLQPPSAEQQAQQSSQKSSDAENSGPSSSPSPPEAAAGDPFFSALTAKNAVNSKSESSLALRPLASDRAFESAEKLIEFVTKRWMGRYVTTDIPTEAVLDAYLRRPFFLLVSVDAPLMLRWHRLQARLKVSGESAMSLEDFVAQSDTHLYDPQVGLQALISRASVRLLNTSSSMAHLYATLGKLDILNPNRLRPGWDTYFMALASLAAQRSNCMKRRVGCVLVGRERRVISTGYNGTPRGIRNCADGGCPRCNDGGSGSGIGLTTCLCIHAEENALLEAGRERIREGSVLYCDTCPCLTCSIKICQVGIAEVVYAEGYCMDSETGDVLRKAGVRLRQFVPPPNGLIHLEKMDLY